MTLHWAPKHSKEYGKYSHIEIFQGKNGGYEIRTGVSRVSDVFPRGNNVPSPFILRVGLCLVYVGWDDDDDEDYIRFQFVADLVKPTVNSEIRLGSLR